MFRTKRGINRTYQEQGYIYFLSRNYERLDSERQKEIESLCFSSGGEHYGALFEFVTTGKSGQEVCREHYISMSTLYRIVKKYYEAFPI